MSDNLKVAKECGLATTHVGIDLVTGGTSQLEAYTSRVLASQQAAHDAEIAKLKEEYDECRADHQKITLDLLDRLSAAKERIAYLEGLVAVKAEALRLSDFATDSMANSLINAIQHIKNLRDGISSFSGALDNLSECKAGSMKDWDNARSAISASAETVQAFHDKLTEPLRREVAQLHNLLRELQHLTINGGWLTTYQQDFECAISNTKATAQAYEQKMKREGAVEALEDAANTFEEQDEHLRIEGDVHVAAERLRRIAAELLENK